jgi:hypothetical protein
MKNYTMYETYKTEAEALAAAEKYATENCGVDTFDGMNCNDYKEDHEPECTGWDGFDRRCDCGNRRVSWDIEKNLDGTFAAWARAY